MPLFKRLKLFVNLSQIDQNNLIYDEVWIYKLKNGEDKKSIGRYRIRYQKSDNPMMFAGDEDISTDDYSEIESVFSHYGPAIICYLEVWSVGGWKRCLDWIGDASTQYLNACQDLNDQYQAFITGTAILDPFVSSPSSGPSGRPKKPKRKEDPENIFTTPKPDPDPNEFDWI